MARYPVTIRLYNCPNLGAPGSLEQILSTVHNAEFEITGLDADFHFESGRDDTFIARNYHGEPPKGLSVAYELRQLFFMCDDNRPDAESPPIYGFEIGWTAPPQDNNRADWILGRVYHDNDCFINKDLNPEYNAHRLLQLGRDLYNATGPSFGYIEAVPYGSFQPLKIGHTTLEDVTDLQLPHIYWANFFGPDYVRHHGKDFLAQAPGWIREDLDDGGFLYVLAPSLSGAGPAEVVRKVRTYFGVEHVRRRPRKRREKKQDQS